MTRFPQALSGLCLVIPSPAYPFSKFCPDFFVPPSLFFTFLGHGSFATGDGGGAVSGCCFLFFSVNVMMIWACHGMGNGYVDTPLFLLFLPIYPFTHQLSNLPIFLFLYASFCLILLPTVVFTVYHSLHLAISLTACSCSYPRASPITYV